MEDQISQANEHSWSKDLAEIRSMLQELVAISKPTPLEFQRFYGENPDLWISQAERYFGFYEIEENQKLSLASSYLDGEALTWYQWLFQNKQLADWDHFTAKVLIRFRKRHLKSPEGCLANLWQWSDISNSPWLQNNDEQSEYPIKIDEHKVFDEMLNSNCFKLFNLAPLDTPIERLDEDTIGPDRSEVQLFHESPQIDMSERYVTTTSLDCGSCHQQIELESFEDMYLAEFFSETESIDDLYLDNFFMKNKVDIPINELPSDEIIPDIKQGKYNMGVKHDEGRAIMDPLEWDLGVTSKDMAPTGCTVNVELLLLLGSTVCASYFDVVGKIHREGIAQVLSSVIAGQTEKILRDHVAFQMVIVFDPGGCTFDAPILEDMNGALNINNSKITTRLKYYVNCYVMFFLSLTMLTRTFQHQHLVLLKYAAMMVEFIQLKGGSLVSFCAEILEVGDCFLVRLQPHRQHSMRWQLGNSWVKRQCRLFEVLRLKHCTNQLVNQQPMLLQNLEDKVLDSGRSIVVNQTNYIRDHGLQVMNETDPINIIGLIKILESFIWDPGPNIKGFNRFGS